MAEQETLEYGGFHGCDLANVDSIKSQNFQIGTRSDLWYGNSVYFFGECKPWNSEEHARYWAIKAATPPGHSKPKFSHYAVLKAVIRPTNLLDMNSEFGKEAFQRTLLMLRARGLPKKNEWEDTGIITFMVDQMKFDVVIVDVYNRFTLENELTLRSRIPNSRLIAVYQPQSCIDKNRIVLLSSGPISQ